MLGEGREDDARRDGEDGRDGREEDNARRNERRGRRGASAKHVREVKVIVADREDIGKPRTARREMVVASGKG